MRTVKVRTMPILSYAMNYAILDNNDTTKVLDIVKLKKIYLMEDPSIELTATLKTKLNIEEEIEIEYVPNMESKIFPEQTAIQNSAFIAHDLLTSYPQYFSDKIIKCKEKHVEGFCITILDESVSLDKYNNMFNYTVKTDEFNFHKDCKEFGDMLSDLASDQILGFFVLPIAIPLVNESGSGIPRFALASVFAIKDEKIINSLPQLNFSKPPQQDIDRTISHDINKMKDKIKAEFKEKINK